MKFFKNNTLKGFVMGILFTLVVSVGIGGAYAKSQNMNISVLVGGIKVYVDDHLQIFKDVNGKVVEPMIYNGTTYLPVRGVANAVGKDVHWDQATMTVSLGEKVAVGQVDLANLNEYYGRDKSYLYVGANANFRKLDKTISAFNRLDSSDTYHYILDSKYSALKAKFDIPYTNIGANYKSEVLFYSVDQYGTETEIAKYESKAGDDTMSVHVNLQGVKILKIRTRSGAALYNITLAGMK